MPFVINKQLETFCASKRIMDSIIPQVEEAEIQNPEVGNSAGIEEKIFKLESLEEFSSQKLGESHRERPEFQFPVSPSPSKINQRNSTTCSPKKQSETSSKKTDDIQLLPSTILDGEVSTIHRNVSLESDRQTSEYISSIEDNEERSSPKNQKLDFQTPPRSRKTDPQKSLSDTPKCRPKTSDDVLLETLEQADSNKSSSLENCSEKVPGQDLIYQQLIQDIYSGVHKLNLPPFWTKNIEANGVSVWFTTSAVSNLTTMDGKTKRTVKSVLTFKNYYYCLL